jgi:hypothetical protein
MSASRCCPCSAFVHLQALGYLVLHARGPAYLSSTASLWPPSCSAARLSQVSWLCVTSNEGETRLKTSKQQSRVAWRNFGSPIKPSAHPSHCQAVHCRSRRSVLERVRWVRTWTPKWGMAMLMWEQSTSESNQTKQRPPINDEFLHHLKVRHLLGPSSRPLLPRYPHEPLCI